MAIAQLAFVGDIVQAQLLAHDPVISFFARQTKNDPTAGQAGKYDIDVITGVTAVTPVDGTPGTNSYASTSVSLVYTDQQVFVKFPPTQWKSISKRSDRIAKVVQKAADALKVPIMRSIIDECIAATPGQTDTLPNGQLNFTTDGTTAEANQNVRLWLGAADYLRATNTAAVDSDFIALCPMEARTNITALRTHFGTFNQEQGRGLNIDGIETYPISGDSDIGGATEPALYICHWESIAVGISSVEVVKEGVFDDGLWGMIINCSYGIETTRANGIAEVLNGAS